MPEYPDVELYLERLRPRVVGQVLRDLRPTGPFLLRSVTPPLGAFLGEPVEGVERLGKRIVLGFPGERFLVMHLMIAGRLRWREAGKKSPGRSVQLILEFDAGTLYLTEAGSKRRASLHAVSGRAGLESMDPGGLEVIDSTLETFSTVLRAENRTLKRRLCDPHALSGIGGAYSDEIMHRAGLSPVARTQSLSDTQVARLHAACGSVLQEWLGRLREELGPVAFPEKVTAFRPGMAVHGRFGEPCPACGATVQRIRYASHETNYCPTCQTDGRVLKDRSLSLLLKDDWPRSPEAWEELRRGPEPGGSESD